MSLDPFFGSVLGAAGNLIGGAISGESTRKANENARDAAAHQMQQQKDFAQHGIKWRADDVMGAYAKTGIHPLALLGVQGPTYSPVTTAFASSPMGDAVGRAGQDISRGIHATADRQLRVRAAEMQEERFKLENDLLRVQIASQSARLRQESSPAMPSPNQRYLIQGQGPTGLVSPKPHEVTRTNPMFPAAEPGIMPDIGVGTTASGSRYIMPSKDFKDRAEDMSWLPFSWFMRNYVAPLFSGESRGHMRSNMGSPGKDHYWQYQPLTGEWTREKIGWYSRMRQKGYTYDKSLPHVRSSRRLPW